MAATYVPGQYERQVGSDLQGAQAAGYFSPQGSPAIMAAVRRNAIRNSDNARRRSALLTRLMGLDPNQARVASVNADANASGATSNALNDAYSGQLFSNQDYFRHLLGGQLGAEQGRSMARYQHDLYAPTLGGEIGQFAGQAAGAFLPGAGSIFRGQQQPQYDPYGFSGAA